MTWKPVEGHIMTRWAARVDPNNAWPEYPRPQMRRAEWINLNGLWEYAILPRTENGPAAYAGLILAPFPVESALSGVKQPLLPEQRLWYRRRFTIPPDWQGKRFLLHFGAVDWEAEVWVNGQKAGIHQGGYDPFYFEITPQLSAAGENELVVAVRDPTGQQGQECGKQSLDPKAIWYSAVSGIWGTVWLEPLPQSYIQNLRLTPDLDAGILLVQANIVEEEEPLRAEIHLAAIEDGTVIAAARGASNQVISLSIPNPKPWSPDSPHLYDLQARLVQDGQVVDKVESYFGMRKFSLGRDARGRIQMYLNNLPLFQFGPLDQGYWPDGLYTPPSEEAMLYDLQTLKALGFNMLRKHVKVEPARYYYHCDRLGLIVWQDMPNGGKPVGSLESLFINLFGSRRKDDRNHARLGRGEAGCRANYQRELKAMIDALYNFPCISVWVPFNEGWGQFNAKTIAAWVKSYDPSRLVDHASGWYDQGGGDFRSLHVYFKKLPAKKPEEKRAIIASEFGGLTLRLPGHVWDEEKIFGYQKCKSSAELTAAYLKLLQEELLPWVRLGLAGAVYTQTTDVEIETNGYLSYDREILKVDAEAARAAHLQLFESAKLGK